MHCYKGGGLVILNIDLNPTVERKYNLDNVLLGKEIKAKSSTYSPGGRGVVSSLLLDNFNEDTFLTGFLGGISGEYFHRALSEISIPHEFVSIKDETRTTMKITDSMGNTTTILEGNPRVIREELVQFYELYNVLIERADIICGLDNSLPLGISKDIFFDLILLAKQRNKKFILDINGEECSNGIDASPFMAILNQNTLEDFIKLSLQFENEIIKAGRFILDKGIDFVVIDLKTRGSLVLSKERGYRVEIPYYGREEYIGQSSMAAGFALGFNRNYDMEIILRLGQAFGIASTIEPDPMKIEISDIKRLMGEVEIFPINYY